MSCELPFGLHLSSEHFTCCWPALSSRWLYHFELAQIVTLSLYLQFISHSRVPRVKLIGGGFIIRLHHLYVALLAVFGGVGELDGVTEVRSFFLDVLFGLGFCFCVLVGGKVELLIKCRKRIIISFCDLLMPRLFLHKFICLHRIQIKHILLLPRLWRYDLTRNPFCISIRLSSQIPWAWPRDWLFPRVIESRVTNRSLCFAPGFDLSLQEELLEGVQAGWGHGLVVSKEVSDHVLLLSLGIAKGRLVDSLFDLASVYGPPHWLWLLVLWNPYDPLFAQVELLLRPFLRMRLLGLWLLSVQRIFIDLVPGAHVARVAWLFIVFLIELFSREFVQGDFALCVSSVEFFLEVGKLDLHSFIDVPLAG